ncbi:MAG: hypothetical protein KatS3mg077_3356 [Candidatus Binatia bacterium]|nr:MAG: hypothetical protein KatS3mg077_3356 [Candidatus Binatia bacterium]
MVVPIRVAYRCLQFSRIAVRAQGVNKTMVAEGREIIEELPVRGGKAACNLGHFGGRGTCADPALVLPLVSLDTVSQGSSARVWRGAAE